VSRLRDLRDLDLYRLELEDRFGQIPGDDEESARFFEVLKVRVLAQRLGVSEVGVQVGKLKLRVSPQTGLDPGKLFAWVQGQKGGAMSPDGTVTIPLGPGGGDAVIRQAQGVLGTWAGL
jgi:transcription-repair coupling factor (superfamily II helicase)